MKTGTRIHPKYLQNSQMVLSILCNDDNICGNKLSELSRYKCIPKLIVSSNVLWGKSPLEYWESCRHLQRRVIQLETRMAKEFFFKNELNFSTHT